MLSLLWHTVLLPDMSFKSLSTSSYPMVSFITSKAYTHVNALIWLRNLNIVEPDIVELDIVQSDIVQPDIVQPDIVQLGVEVLYT